MGFFKVPFEWDTKKTDTNTRKHRVSFEEARTARVGWGEERNPTYMAGAFRICSHAGA